MDSCSKRKIAGVQQVPGPVGRSLRAEGRASHLKYPALLWGTSIRPDPGFLEKILMNQAPAPNFPVTDRVREALAVTLRGCEELIPEMDWVQKLARSEATKTPLRIKLGLDPTAPDIHIGHTVVLNKMRQLQDLGHQVIFLIGDFTSLIGDPSGRNSTRPPLTPEQIKLNAETYYKQASLVLDPQKTEIRYNSEWSLPLGSMGMIQLAAKYTVARMLSLIHI